jgi:predicted protein tyrosine phosphatase
MAILVCPLSRVLDQVRTHRPSRVVSLLDPGTQWPDVSQDGIDAHLKVGVHDILEPQAGCTDPQAHHVHEILDFLRPWDQAAPLLIHCYAGISRSTATAFIAACLHNPDVEEIVLARALRSASSSAHPNRRIVALADAALGRAGRMSQAILAIGPGANWHEIGEAQPFAIAARHG